MNVMPKNKSQTDQRPTANQHGRLVDEKVLLLVKKTIKNDWRDLGRAFAMTEEELNKLESDNEESTIDDLPFHLLEKWKIKEKENATVKVLIDCLKIIGRMDIVHKILCLITSPYTSPLTSPSDEESSTSDEWAENTIGANERMRALPRGVLGWMSMQHNLDHNIGRLRRKLMRKYHNVKLNGLRWMGYPWMDLSMEDNYVDLSLTSCSIQSENQKESIKLEDIFKTNEDDWKPLNILIEGHSGYGKTTLASKLCYDWSRKQQKYLNDFDIVLYLSLRQYEANLKDMLIKATANVWKDFDTLWAIINDPAKRILFIFDGYKKTVSAHVDTVLQMLQDDFLPHVTVIVTAEPGRFPRKLPENDAEADSSSSTIKWNRQITINGIIPQDRKTVIEKCVQLFPENSRHGIKHKIDADNIRTSEMYSSPLILLTRIALLMDGYSLYDVDTIPDLYKATYNFAVRRYLNQMHLCGAKTNDLFSLHAEQTPQLSDELFQFGKNSADTLLKGDFSHLEGEFCSILKHHSSSFEKWASEKENVVYEPFHTLMLEFAVAYYLWVLYLKKKEAWREEVMRWKPSNSMFVSCVIRFLKDLMGPKEDKLLDAIGLQRPRYNTLFNLAGFKPFATRPDIGSRRPSFSSPSLP